MIPPKSSKCKFGIDAERSKLIATLYGDLSRFKGGINLLIF